MQNKTQWTNEQHEVIFEHWGENLLVSAAAGSGKTAVLVERIIQLIKAGRADIDEMLIATFTNAAASEMREKIIKRFQEEGMDDQIELMGHASVGSLDSFSNSVVKRYYHIIGVDPGLSTCDNTKAALLKEETLDDLFEEKFASKDADFLYFLDCYDTSDANDDTVRSMILSLHNFLMSMPQPWAYADWACSGDSSIIDRYMNFAKQRSLSLLRCAEKYHLNFVNRLKLEKLDKLADKANIDLAYVQSLIAAAESNPEVFFKIVLEPHKNQTISLKKTPLEGIEKEIKAQRDRAKDLLDKLKKSFGGITRTQLEMEQAAMQPAIKIYFNLVREFDKIYAEKKKLEKSLDFSDMNHFALRILENETVCSEYKEQYKFIFIDEFQDTNSVQESLINRISRGNNLFMVGDVKQSIYKFRLAEPEIFIRIYNDYKAGAGQNNKAIDLNRNFRSKESVINCVNTVFSPLMTMDSCEMVYDEAASLKKGSKYDGPIDFEAQLRLLNSEKSDNDDPMIAELDKNELEALQIASIIKEYHGKIIHDDKAQVDRKLEYRDMVVLMRGIKSSGEIIYRALLDADIPVYLDRSEGYFDSIEIQVFLNLLRLINNRKQDMALLSVLCCPVFGFTAAELAAVRIYGNEVLNKPNADFYEVFYQYASVNEKAAAFVEKLEGYREKLGVMPLADFIYHILLTSGYGDFALSQNAGEQKLANLRALVDRAEKFEKDNLSGLAGFISFAEVLAKSGKNIDIGPAKILSESADCVRIMTVHKSKGLEFPFVLYAGLVSSNLSKSSSSYALHKSFGCALQPVNPKTGVYADTKLLYLINLKKQIEDRAEEIRIMYVACTRAVDILVFSACQKMSATGTVKLNSLLAGDVDLASHHLDLLYPCIPKDIVRITNKNSLGAFKKKTQESRDAFRTSLLEISSDAYDEEVSKVLDFEYFSKDLPPKKKYSVSELAELARTGVDHYKLSTDDEAAAEPASAVESELSGFIDDAGNIAYEVPQFIAVSEHKLSGAEKGTAYHAVMEHIPFTADGKSLEDIKEFVEELSAKNILTKAQADCIEPAKIKAFFDSEIGKRAIASSEIHKEAPFVMKHMHDGHVVLVQGTIDCYFEEDGEYVLVDYKSNYVDKAHKDAAYEHLKEVYMPQLELYREALEKICDKKVKLAVLYLIGTGDTIEIKSE